MSVDMGQDLMESKEVKTSWFQTYTGIRFYPFDPKIEQVNLADIGHQCSHENRWGGAAKFPIDVANHQVMTWRLAKFLYPDRKDVQDWSLFHDSGEAYLGDIKRPIRKFIKIFDQMELEVLEVIAAKYDLPWPIPEEVWRLDNLQLAVENQHALNVFIPGLYEDLYKDFIRRLPADVDQKFLADVWAHGNAYWFLPREQNWKESRTEWARIAAESGFSD